MVSGLERRGARLAVALAVAALVTLARAPAAPARAAAEQPPSWLGEDLPLPITVKTQQDIALKAAIERQYLIFNLMAGGKWAFQRGDYATAIEKWEALLKTPGLDPQVERAIAPALAEARRRPQRPSVRPAPPPPAEVEHPTPPVAEVDTPMPPTPAPPARPPSDGRTTVSGVVSGGGQVGPGGAVVWLKRLDGPTPRPAPAEGRFITQREKTFLPHVLPVTVGSTVEFRNEDRIYHNVFSLNRPNDFDAGIRASGTVYSRRFDKAGPVEILCNIHSTMNAYVVVVDTALFTKVRPSGTFTIRGVVPGRYEVSVWHEAASAIARRPIVVPADGLSGISLTVSGDKRPGPFVPDKYGHKRQPHLGY